MQSVTQTLERAIARFQALLLGQPQVAQEFASTRSAFLEQEGIAGDLGARRHLEWFLLERPSEHLESVPLAALGEDWLAAAEGPEQDLFAGLQQSYSSAFVVRAVEPGRELVIQDLMGLSELAVREEAGSQLLEAQLLEVGDLLVGRIFPIAEGLVLCSPAMSCFRDAGLVAALKRDLENLRASRRGVLRMQQIELERMFFSPGSQPQRMSTGAQPKSADDPASEALVALQSAGLDLDQAQEMVQRTLQAPNGQAVTELLNHLAFHTTVDLEQARDALAALWSDPSRKENLTGKETDRGPLKRPSGGDSPARSETAHPAERNGNQSSAAGDPKTEESSAPRAPSEAPSKARSPLDFFGVGKTPTSPSTNGKPVLDTSQHQELPTTDDRAAADPAQARAALESFDQGRAEGKDIEALFGQLEADLEIDVSDSSEEPDEGAPDFPGVVAAMLVEFRWELERQGRVLDPAAVRVLEAFASATDSVGVFEDLPADALLSFATQNALDQGVLLSKEDAAVMLKALGEFASWCDEHQGLEIAHAFQARVDELSKSLPRLAQARQALGDQASSGGELFEVAMVGGSRIALRPMRTGQNDPSEEHEIDVPEPVARHLMRGDFARVALGKGAGLLLGVHPPEARALFFPS